MHIVENKFTSGKKTHTSILLRESYRENGKVKKRTIANLSHCTQKEIAALKLALKHKDDLCALGSFKELVELHEGLSVGAVWTVYQIAIRLGIEKALGRSLAGKLALLQVIARVIDHSSVSSVVGLSQFHAACDVLNITPRFDEHTMHDNLEWLSSKQEKIERILLSMCGKAKPRLFLYDVTSIYLVEKQNYFPESDYHGDHKNGEDQIVIGLLLDEHGNAVSTKILRRNVNNPRTYVLQVKKWVESLGCEVVTWVMDGEMFKVAQIDNLSKGFHYITTITNLQIQTLIKQGIIRRTMFDKEVYEIKDKEARYILWRDTVRAKEITLDCLSKRRGIENLIRNKNAYLENHPKSKVSKAIEHLRKKIEHLNLDKWLSVKEEKRVLSLSQDDKAMDEELLLYSCCVVKTDLPHDMADKQTVYDRYKDLTEVNKVFPDCKTAYPEIHPVFVKTEEYTHGQLLVEMFADMITRKLRKAWTGLDLTVQEGLSHLSTVCSIKLLVKGSGSCLKIPRPRKKSRELLKALNIRMPSFLPHRALRVVTRKKLPDQ